VKVFKRERKKKGNLPISKGISVRLHSEISSELRSDKVWIIKGVYKRIFSCGNSKWKELWSKSTIDSMIMIKISFFLKKKRKKEKRKEEIYDRFAYFLQFWVSWIQHNYLVDQCASKLEVVISI